MIGLDSNVPQDSPWYSTGLSNMGTGPFVMMAVMLCLEGVQGLRLVIMEGVM